MRRTLAPSLLCAALLVAAPALAQDSAGGSTQPELNMRRPGGFMDASPQRRPTMAAVFVGFPYYYSGWGGLPLVISGRYYLPLLHDGIIPTANDSIGLDVGADLAFLFGNGTTFLSIPVEATWMLHFLPEFAGYLKLGAALELGFAQSVCWGNRCINGSSLWVHAIGAVGVMARLSQGLLLRIELGYPWAKVGLGWTF